MAANSVALYWIIISIENFAVVIFRCLFYNLGMVWYIVEKGEGGTDNDYRWIKNRIDNLWEIFWTGGLTNPPDVIEQMTWQSRGKA